MTERSDFPSAMLDNAGLNRQHLFDLAGLPQSVRKTLGDTTGFSQLLLLGHGGRQLWNAMQAAGIEGRDPIDRFSCQILAQWFSQELPGCRYRVLYPVDTPVGLQALGELAGWHQPTPFRVGIDPEWGTWFAYRAAVLCSTPFSPFLRVDRDFPCTSCAQSPCIVACPPQALANGVFNLNACLEWRMLPGSSCASTCLARLACPVGAAHRYDETQIRHSYGRSLRELRQYLKP